MTMTPPFRPTPLPALYESLQAPLTVYLPRQKKDFLSISVDFSKKNQSRKTHKKVTSIFRDFFVKNPWDPRHGVLAEPLQRGPESTQRPQRVRRRGGGRDGGVS